MEKALAIQGEVQRILGTEDVYLVGGSVRDLVMGNTPKDYDFTTSMLPEEMVEKVKAAGRRVYTIGEKFGTIGFKVPLTELVGVSKVSEGLEAETTTNFEYVEVTTFRSETYTSKSRKPEVAFVTSLEEDLARRDFTMNAMVLRSDGTIYDPYGGKLDIYKKQVVTVGWPKDRIQEDPLRILRAARFAARYGFIVDPNFTGKARQLADRILDVSKERWVLELDKLLMGDFHSVGVQLLEDFGVLKFMIPELSFMMNQHRPLGSPDERRQYHFDMEASFANPIFNPEDDVDTRWKKWLEKTSMPASRKYKEYGYIGYDQQAKIAREINTGICHRLKFSNERTNFILDKSKKRV